MTTQTMTRVDSFQPEKGDILLKTKTWEESQPPFIINYTERTYQRGRQSVRVVNKRFTGPPGPIQRLGWKKFGTAATGNFATEIKGDVYLELVQKAQLCDNWIPNGIYINAAKKDNWSQIEINQIIRSDRPDLMYRKIQKSKVNTHLAKLNLKLNLTDTNPAVTDSDPSVKMGLRERMLHKQRNRTDTEESSLPKPNSLSARMNQRRDDAKQQHDEQLCTLFLQNIPEDYSEADIKTHIQDYKYRRVNVVRREGESIGKAFIELESAEETQTCLEAINGQKWGYCVIEVQLSKPKPKPKPTDDPKSVGSKHKPNTPSNFKKPKPRSAGGRRY